LIIPVNAPLNLIKEIDWYTEEHQISQGKHPLILEVESIFLLLANKNLIEMFIHLGSYSHVCVARRTE
jgi:hypothetical protein